MDHVQQPSPAPATVAQIAAWVGLLIAVLSLYLRGVGAFQVGAYQDDAAYVVLARSIAFGDAYGPINRPGPLPSPKFPFGFPLLLAPVVHWFPQPLLAATAVPLAATLVNLSLLFWGWPLLSPTTSRWWGVAVAWLHGLSPLVVAHTRIVMSEPVFTTFVLCALLLTERCVRGRSGGWTSIALGVALTFAFFTRTIGIALWPAALVRVIRANGRKDLPGICIGCAALLVLVVALTPVQMRQLPPWRYAAEAQAGTGPPAEQRAEGFLDQMVRVVTAYVLGDIRAALLPLGGGERERAFAERLGIRHGPEITGFAVAAVTAAGAWQTLQTGALAPSALLFELLYCGILVIWPWSTPRYLYPLHPLLCFQFLFGLTCVVSWALGSRRRRAAAAARAGAGVVAAAWTVLVLASAWKSLDRSDSRDSARDLMADTTWIAANSGADAIVMARYPAAIYLYSDRRTVPLPAQPSALELDRLLTEQQVDYILIAPELSWDAHGGLDYTDTDRSLLPILAEMGARGRLELVYASEPRQKILVYRVNKPQRSAADGARGSRVRRL